MHMAIAVDSVCTTCITGGGLTYASPLMGAHEYE